MARAILRRHLCEMDALAGHIYLPRRGLHDALYAGVRDIQLPCARFGVIDSSLALVVRARRNVARGAKLGD